MIRWFIILICLSFTSSIYAQLLNKFKPVKGFADLHNHMVAEYAFAGAWLHGSHQGPEHIAMASCNGNKGHASHAKTGIPGLNELIGALKGSPGDTGRHYKKRHGYPTYQGWPRWDTIAHQQMYEGHLFEAFKDGLSFMVVSMVNFSPLCKLTPKRNRKHGSCEDMDSINKQLDALHAFVKSKDWLEIALDPFHAREIIHSGKMAIMIAVEATDVFRNGDWKPQLDELYKRGVRSLQPAHQLNNRFTGVAPHIFIFKIFQLMRNISKGKIYGFQLDDDGKNILGLTEDGRGLIKAMIEKNMIVDFSHLSEKAFREASKILKEKNHPIFVSHGHIRRMMVGEKATREKTIPNEFVKLIRESGGMLGLRTGPEAVKSFGTVPNDCDGSTKSFAQVYQYTQQELNLNIGFASDLNGFIQQLRPRFGGKKETCGAAKNKRERKKQQRAQAKKTNTSFDSSGFGHIGQIGRIIDELKSFGVDTENLDHSAENFLKMWQRAY